MSLKGHYLLGLDCTLSSHSYKYSRVERVLPGDTDSHIVLQFSAEVSRWLFEGLGGYKSALTAGASVGEGVTI